MFDKRKNESKAPKKKALAPKRKSASAAPTRTYGRDAAPVAASGARNSDIRGFRGKASKSVAVRKPDARGPRVVKASKGLGKRGGEAVLKRKPTILHKPAPRKAVDLGIGAVEIAPPKDAVRTIGIAAAEAALDKKAFDVVVLDVRGISGLCDEMVVVSARSVPHLSAVCDGIEESLRKIGERVLHADGRHSAEPDWILLDYGDLMVHIFRPEARIQTRLEDYYASARLVAKYKND